MDIILFLTLVHEPICTQNLSAVLARHCNRWQNSLLSSRFTCDSLESTTFNAKVFSSFFDHYEFQQPFNGSEIDLN